MTPTSEQEREIRQHHREGWLATQEERAYLLDLVGTLRDENASLRMQLRVVAGSTVSLEPPE
jgi:hypothetical protein